MIHSLNPIESRALASHLGSKTSINFTVVSSYRGGLTFEVLERALVLLYQRHEYLRVTIKIIDLEYKFCELDHFKTPCKMIAYEDSDQWKRVANKEIEKRFSKDHKPLWHVLFLRGNEKGQILFTFHHAIADGICGVSVMDHLYRLMSAILFNQSCSISFDSDMPPFESLYEKFDKANEGMSSTNYENLCSSSYSTSNEFHTAFTKFVVNLSLTQKILAWSKKQEISVHASLYAAYLLAFSQIYPGFDQFEALTDVNCRRYFKEPKVSHELLRALNSYVISDIKVSDYNNFVDLAKAIYESVHERLKRGDPILFLKDQNIPKRVGDLLTPQEFMASQKSPPNTTFFSNVGDVKLRGDYRPSEEGYPDFYMEELFFYANLGPFCGSDFNILLAALTFQGKIFLTLSRPQEGSTEQVNQALLLKMNEILELTCVPF